MNRKIILWWTVACLIAAQASASVVISQVLYNPEGSESGGEAIELYNSGNDDIDISEWVIATEASAADAEMPENTVICAGCYYLVADRGWNGSRDNLSWPEADTEQPLTMYNTNSGIALLADEATVDAVGWGNPDEITDGLFEETPADGVNEGNSLLRIHDTTINKFDFEESTPFFRSSSDIGTGTDSSEVIIEFEVVNSSASQQDSATIDFINLSSRKVAPVPGGASSITVNALITGHGFDNVTATMPGKTKSMAKEEVNSTASIFSASFDLDYFTPPGTYPIVIEAGDETMEIEFEYLELVAIEVSRENLNFGKITTGGEHFAEIKVRNIGNAILDVGVKSEGFSIGNIMEYSFDNNNYKTITSNTVINDINLNYGENSETALKLKIIPPTSTQTGKYDSKVEITAVGSK